MAMDYSYLAMEITIKGNIKQVDFMEKEDMYGKMGHHMMEHLWMVVEKELENGNLVKMTVMSTLDNIKMIKNQVKANTHGTMVQFTKDILSTILSTHLFYYRHGQGKVEYPDGREIRGYWQSGKLVEVDQNI